MEKTEAPPKESFLKRLGNFFQRISLNFIPFEIFLNKEKIIEECKKKLIVIEEKLETIKEPDLSAYKVKALRILEDIKITAVSFNDNELCSKVDRVNNMICIQYHVTE